MVKRVAILTGGGDCPGLNAFIRAVVKSAVIEYGWKIFGIQDGFEGLLWPGRHVRLGYDDASGICVDDEANGFGAPCGVALGGCDGVANGVCIKASLAHGSFCSVPCAPFTTPCPVDVPGATCFQGTTSTFCLITCRPADDPGSCPTGTSCVSLPGGIDACLPPPS